MLKSITLNEQKSFRRQKYNRDNIYFPNFKTQNDSCEQLIYPENKQINKHRLFKTIPDQDEAMPQISAALTSTMTISFYENIHQKKRKNKNKQHSKDNKHTNQIHLFTDLQQIQPVKNIFSKFPSLPENILQTQINESQIKSEKEFKLTPIKKSFQPFKFLKAKKSVQNIKSSFKIKQKKPSKKIEQKQTIKNIPEQKIEKKKKIQSLSPQPLMFSDAIINYFIN